MSIEHGHVIDYLHVTDDVGGEPFPYIRRADESQVQSEDEYKQRFGVDIPELLLGREPTREDSRPYLDHLSFDPSPEGYLQFALFNMMIRRFYLFWHSAYNSRYFVIDKVDADPRILQGMGERIGESIEPLVGYRLTPAVSLDARQGIVRLFSFERNRGFSYCFVSCEEPNILVRIEDEAIIGTTTVRMF